MLDSTVPCEAADYLDKTRGCTPCPEASWSPGGLLESCSPCTPGKSVDAGKGTSENDCVWRKYKYCILVDKLIKVFMISLLLYDLAATL